MLGSKEKTQLTGMEDQGRQKQTQISSFFTRLKVKLRQQGSITMYLSQTTTYRE